MTEGERVIRLALMHGGEQLLDECGVTGLCAGEADFRTHAVEPVALEGLAEGLDHRGCGRDRRRRVRVDEVEQRFGEAGQVPPGNRGLVGKGIAAAVIDRAEHLRGVVRIEERAGAIVDRLARDRHVVGVHHAVDEADLHPARDERRLARRDRLEECEIRPWRGDELRIMPLDHVIGEQPQRLSILPCREILECADADVAGGDAGQHRARQHAVASHFLAGRDCGKRARRGHAERMHRLAHDIFAQHGAERGATVAAPGEGRWTGAFEVHVPPDARAVDKFAQQQGAAVAKLRHEVAELVSGIGECDGLGVCGEHIAGEEQGGRGLHGIDIEPELPRERAVEGEQTRCRRLRRLDLRKEACRQAAIGIVEPEPDHPRASHGVHEPRASAGHSAR